MWIAVQREDGETVGYLEPLDPAYDQLLARSVLGHLVAGPCDYLTGEELLVERGIGELMQDWSLNDSAPGSATQLSILEVSPQGIVLADALLTKALSPTPKIVISWPDTQGRLSAYTPAK